MIVVVDYGVGNLSSVVNMLKKAGAEVCVSSDPNKILTAEKLLLPGVGHFDYGMSMLNGSGLRDALDRAVLENKTPVLGICLGAQIIGHGSEEGDSEGLGWIDMECHKLQPSSGVRVPHMGWNKINVRKRSQIFKSKDEEARYYFVHSFRMECSDINDVLATSEHGIEFTCAVERENIIGTQFHPEKSLRHGLNLMSAFVEFNYE